MRNKYGNKKIIRDGEKFDSIKEYNRFCELRLLEIAGEITDLKRQVKFNLIPTMREPSSEMSRSGKFKKGKAIERGVDYVADFVYKNKLGLEVVEDTKGVRTKDYIIKRKLMYYFRRIRIKEI